MPYSRFCCPGGPQSENQKKKKKKKKKKRKKEKRGKYEDLARELKKLLNMRVTVIPIVIGALGKKAVRTENQSLNLDHPNYSIAKIGQNTE